MSMTVVVTRNVEGRTRGFLASTMLEVAPAVYTSPTMTPAVRERIWAVLEKWRVGSRDDSAVMVWPDPAAPGGQQVRTLGAPAVSLVETSSIILARRALTAAELRSLTDPPF